MDSLHLAFLDAAAEGKPRCDGSEDAENCPVIYGQPTHTLFNACFSGQLRDDCHRN
jgi:hypothetical protein